MVERTTSKSKLEVTLKAQSNKDKKGKGKWNGNKGIGGHNNSNDRKYQKEARSSSTKQSNNQGVIEVVITIEVEEKKNKFDKSSIQWYNCKKYGHFTDESYGSKKYQEDDAKLAKQENEDVLLMVTTKEEERYIDQRYLDSGCSSHMIGRKEWFVSINQSLKNKMKFTSDNTLVAEGIDDVLIMRKYGKQSMMTNVLYITSMKSNLLKIGQLIEKIHKVLIEYKMMRTHNSRGKLILKEPMSQNRTFKI